VKAVGSSSQTLTRAGRKSGKGERLGSKSYVKGNNIGGGGKTAKEKKHGPKEERSRENSATLSSSPKVTETWWPSIEGKGEKKKPYLLWSQRKEKTFS